MCGSRKGGLSAWIAVTTYQPKRRFQCTEPELNPNTSAVAWRCRGKLAAKSADLEANTPYASSSAFADAAGAGGMKDPDYQFPEVREPRRAAAMHTCTAALPASTVGETVARKGCTVLWRPVPTRGCRLCCAKPGQLWRMRNVAHLRRCTRSGDHAGCRKWQSRAGSAGAGPSSRCSACSWAGACGSCAQTSTF